MCKRLGAVLFLRLSCCYVSAALLSSVKSLCCVVCVSSLHCSDPADTACCRRPGASPSHVDGVMCPAVPQAAADVVRNIDSLLAMFWCLSRLLGLTFGVRLIRVLLRVLNRWECLRLS
jgi:hypothetical protein